MVPVWLLHSQSISNGTVERGDELPLYQAGVIMRHQLHIWISEDDRQFLEATARDRDESVSATLRRVIRALRRSGGPNARSVTHDAIPPSQTLAASNPRAKTLPG
jgi:hypothetical protein